MSTTKTKPKAGARTHTPSPWDWHSQDGYVFVTCDEGTRHGDVVTSIRIDTETGAEEEANARLIAAAPELLVALKAIMGNNDLSRNDWPDGTMQVLRQAVSAIEKATAI